MLQLQVESHPSTTHGLPSQFHTLAQPYPAFLGKHRLDEVDEDDERPEEDAYSVNDGSLLSKSPRIGTLSKRRRPNSNVKENEAALSRLETLSLAALPLAEHALRNTMQGAKHRSSSPAFFAGSSANEGTSFKRSEKDTKMERYDPSRPHVVFVDTLSDTDDEDQGDSSSLLSLTDDEVTAPTISGRRKIRLNNRLRDQLRRQQVLTRGPDSGATGSLIGEILADSGVQERGLVLYRPFNWGVVEELDEGDEKVQLNMKGGEEGPIIEEIYEEVSSMEQMQEQGKEARGPNAESDVEMDID